MDGADDASAVALIQHSSGGLRGLRPSCDTCAKCCVDESHQRRSSVNWRLAALGAFAVLCAWMATASCTSSYLCTTSRASPDVCCSPGVCAVARRLWRCIVVDCGVKLSSRSYIVASAAFLAGAVAVLALPRSRASKKGPFMIDLSGCTLTFKTGSFLLGLARAFAENQ